MRFPRCLPEAYRINFVALLLIGCTGCALEEGDLARPLQQIQSSDPPRIGSVYAISTSPLMAPTPAVAEELSRAIEAGDDDTIKRLQKAELVGTQEPPTEEQFQKMEERGLMVRKSKDGLSLMVIEVHNDSDASYAGCRLLFHGDDLTENHVYVPLVYFSRAELTLVE